MAFPIGLFLWGCENWALTKRQKKTPSVSSKMREKNL